MDRCVTRAEVVVGPLALGKKICYRPRLSLGTGGVGQEFRASTSAKSARESCRIRGPKQTARQVEVSERGPIGEYRDINNAGEKARRIREIKR
jgi:hypothetical protein